MPNRYCLDSDTLIQAKNRFYGFNVVPIFWDWLKIRTGEGTICTSRLVYDEILEGEDELSDWMIENWPAMSIVEIDDEVQRKYTEIADYVNRNHPTHHVQQFLAGADPWVIAKGKIKNFIVVTQEAPVNDKSKKVKIPNICKKFDVQSMDLFAMIGELGGIR